ncbi:hypothetical protein [Kistimonas scapharcae]
MSLIKTGVRFFEKLIQKPKTQQKQDKTKARLTIADISRQMPEDTNTPKTTKPIADRSIQTQQPTASLQHEEKTLDPRIKWGRENSANWKEMDNLLFDKDGSISESGFRKLLGNLETFDLGNKDKCQHWAFYAADKYQTQQFDHEKMAIFMDKFMECYVEAISKEQVGKALCEINSKPDIPSLFLTAELIVLSQDRTTKETSHTSNIKTYIPVANFGWEGLDHQKHGNKIDELFSQKLQNALQVKCKKIKVSEKKKRKLNKEIEKQTLKHLNRKLYEQDKKILNTIASGKPTKEIREQIKNEVIDRQNDIIKALREAEIDIPPQTPKEHQNLTKAMDKIIERRLKEKNGYDVKREKDLDQSNQQDTVKVTSAIPATPPEIKQHSSEIPNLAPPMKHQQAASDTSNVPLPKASGVIGTLDQRNTDAPELHDSSKDESSATTHLPHSILKELADESSTKAQAWRTSGRFSKLESDTNEIAEQADVANKATANEQKNTESLDQQTTTAKSEKPAPNPRPEGLTLIRHTKPQTTTKTESLQDQPSDKANAERLKKSDESTHQSNIKNQEAQIQNTHPPKPALKPKPAPKPALKPKPTLKPVLTKQPKEPLNLNTSKAQEPQKPDTHQAEPEFKSNPAPNKMLDEPVHQSTVITEKNQRTASQRPNSQLKLNPVTPEKLKWPARESSKETTMTTQANDGISNPSPNSKPPAPKKPDRLIQKKPKKPNIPPKPSKETLLNSQRKAFSKNTANAP